ncbi:MAG: response regulator transcription factor [Dehalogenimonas sp.]
MTVSELGHQGKTRVYLADDHEIFRTGLRTVLRFAGEVEIVGDSAILPEILELIEAAEPDILLIGDGPETSRLIQSITERFPSIKILVLGSDTVPFSPLKIGGYLSKESSSDLVRSAIKTIALGASVWNPVSLELMFKPGEINCSKPGSNPGNIVLTEREKQLLSLLAGGKTNKEISLELGIAQVTVKKALQTLFAKIGGTNRTQTVMKASQLGLIE